MKLKFFFHWRTKFMKLKLLESRKQNMESALKQKAFIAIAKNYEAKLKVKQCRLDRKLKLI